MSADSDTNQTFREIMARNAILNFQEYWISRDNSPGSAHSMAYGIDAEVADIGDSAC